MTAVPSRPRRARPARRLLPARATLRALAVVAALPALVAVLSLIGRGWLPTGDRSLQLLQTLDVGGRHTPLVGVYSRYRWNHPGPSQFFFAAPFVTLLGARGLLVATGLVQGLSGSVAVLAAGRRGGRLAAGLVTLAVLAIENAADRSVLLDPWNPLIGMIALLACFVCVWSALAGDGPALVGAVLTGSWCVQAHVGSAPVVGAAAVAGVIGWRVERWANPDRERAPGHRRWTIAAVAAGGLMWLPPVLQQLSGSPGNLTKVWEYLRSGRPTVGWGDAFGYAAHQLGVPAPWMGASELDRFGLVRQASVAPTVVLVVAVAALGAWAARRKAGDTATLCLLAVAVAGATPTAISRISDFPAPYLFRWAWASGALVTIAAVYAAARLLMRCWRVPALDWVGVGGLVAVAALAVVAVAGQVRPPLPDQVGSDALRSLSRQVRSRLDPHSLYRIEWQDGRDFGGVSVGLASDLMSRGWMLAPPPDCWWFDHWAVWVLSDRTGVPTILVHGILALAPWKPPPGARRIASYDSVDPAAAAQADELERRVLDEQRRSHPGSQPLGDVTGEFQQAMAITNGASPDEVRRLGAIQLRRARYDVWLVPSTS